MNAPEGAQSKARTAPEVAFSESDPSLWLKGLFARLPEARWVSLWQVCHEESAPSVRSLGLWPPDTNQLVAVRSLAVRCALSGRIVSVGDADPSLLAIPLRALAAREGACILVLGSEPVSAERRSGIVKLCIEAGAEKQVAEADLETVARHLSHELLRSVNRGDDADDQAVVLVNALVRQLGCRRVTMAKAHPQGARLLVMSGQTHVDQRRELGSQILQLLENTIRDGKARWWPPIEQSPLSAGSQSLVDECVRYFSLNGSMPFLAFSSSEDNVEKRALLIEWDEDIQREPYDKDELATAIEPTLEFLQNWQARSQGGFAGLKRHVRLNRSRGLLALLPKRYYLLLGSALLLLCSHLIEVPQRVTARVSVEAANRQIISAPQDGFLSFAAVRAGDRVKKDAVLARLDDQELLLSISRWEAELRRNDEERNRALATRDRVELGRLRADKTRIKAELASAIAVRDRSELRAPFDALVLKGEPGLSLGAPVVAGDVLFEIAVDDGYRLMLKVDESDVALVESGQQARVRMSAMPSQVLLASLSDVLPVAVAEHGASVYRTPAILMDQGVALRPGMQGVARIEVGKNSLFEVYTRQLRDRLRLLAWRFGILS